MISNQDEQKIISKQYTKRIQSIIKLHILLFDSSLFSCHAHIREGYEKLLDFYKNPEKQKLDKILSILRNHEIIFANGFVDKDEELIKEIPKLLRYVESLNIKRSRMIKRSDIFPQNFGTSFLRKQLGAPLFGLYRPRFLPKKSGVILCYQSSDADGIGRISAVRLDGLTDIRYHELGVELSSKSSWLYLRLLPSGEDAVLYPQEAFYPKEPSVFISDKYTVYLAASKVKRSFQQIVMDPFSYQYTYYFYDDSLLIKKFTRFLDDLLSGKYSIPSNSREQIIFQFIQRLL